MICLYCKKCNLRYNSSIYCPHTRCLGVGIVNQWATADGWFLHICKFLHFFLDIALNQSREMGLHSRGSNSAIFIFAGHLNEGPLLKERICSFRSKFFPLGVDPNLEGLTCSEKKTLAVMKAVNHRKFGGKMVVDRSP